jgi:hypothetical protein
VVIDDFLPVNGLNQLIYCRNEVDGTEMIGPLLEKAFAKLFSCYEFLIAGEPVDAIVDLCGGVCERFSLSKIRDHNCKNVDKNNLWNLVYTASSMKSLLTTCIKTKDPNVMGHLEKLGLVIGHAYCIIEAVEIFFNNKSNSFDKLREPTDKQGQFNSIKLLKYFFSYIRIYIITFLVYLDYFTTKRLLVYYLMGKLVGNACYQRFCLVKDFLYY